MKFRYPRALLESPKKYHRKSGVFVFAMKKIVVSGLVVLVSCALFAQGSSTTPVATQTGVTTTASPEVEQFQSLENKWSDAVNDRDQYALELILSPLFVDVAATGDITTRNQQLANLISTDDKTMTLEQKVITVRMLGDTAVANGTYLLHHKANSGQVDEKGVFTHVYEKVRGNWLCVNSQRTTLREDSPGKQKKSANAEGLFHLPLFSKSDKKD